MSVYPKESVKFRYDPCGQRKLLEPARDRAKDSGSVTSQLLAQQTLGQYQTIDLSISVRASFSLPTAYI